MKNLVYHHNFSSLILKNSRTIVVWLPPGYSQSNQHYPVLYLHDGQNLFEARDSLSGYSWQADRTAASLIKENKIDKLLMVGIYHQDNRLWEYTPFADKDIGGGGEAYLDFVLQEVKPFIDKNYRTKPERSSTALAGSSLGGLISLYALFRYPDVFSKVGVMSPALYWCRGKIFRFISTAGFSRHNDSKIYLDMGTREGDTLKSFANSIKLVRRLRKQLIGLGFTETESLFYLEDEGARHDEIAWANRFKNVLMFFFGR